MLPGHAEGITSFDIFFAADRAEKARARRASFWPNALCWCLLCSWSLSSFAAVEASVPPELRTVPNGAATNLGAALNSYLLEPVRGGEASAAASFDGMPRKADGACLLYPYQDRIRAA